MAGHRHTPELDRQLEAAQAALLERLAPGTRISRVRWSRGETQVLELGAGPPLLLVHGGFDNAFVWAPILPALARGRRVLAVDLPGHGLADPFDYTGVDLLECARTYVGDVLDALELRAADLVGCSVGGLFSVAFALEAPDRITRLVLVGAPPGVTRHVPRQLRLLCLPLVGQSIGRLLMSRPTREGSRKLWGQLAVVHPEGLDDEFLDADVASQRRNSRSHLSLIACLGDARGLRRSLILVNRWLELAVPTVFLCGERDVFVPPRAGRAWAEIASGNPSISVVRIPDAGHLPWFDHPERVVAEIEHFLATEPRTGEEAAA